MNKLNKNIKLSSLLFYSGWTLFIISYTIFKASEVAYIINTDNIYKFLKLIVIIIFLLKIIICDKFKLKKLLLYTFIIFLSFINSFLVDNTTLFFTLLVCLSSSEIDIKKLLKFDIKVKIGLMILIVALCFLDILPNFSKEINGNIKQSFGFSHPNVLCFYIITILLEYMYIVDKINIKYILTNVIVLFILNSICLSRTAIYTFIPIFLINTFVSNKEKIFNKKIIKSLFIILPIIISLSSLIIVNEYGKNNIFVKEIDKVFTTRIVNAYKFYSNYGITMFGNKIETIGTRAAIEQGIESKILDMGYINIFISYGIIVGILFVFLLCFYQKKLINKKEYCLLLISTFYIISGFAETNVFNIAINFSIIGFSYFSGLTSDFRRRKGDMYE